MVLSGSFVYPHELMADWESWFPATCQHHKGDRASLRKDLVGSSSVQNWEYGFNRIHVVFTSS